MGNMLDQYGNGMLGSFGSYDEVGLYGCFVAILSDLTT